MTFDPLTFSRGFPSLEGLVDSFYDLIDREDESVSSYFRDRFLDGGTDKEALEHLCRSSSSKEQWQKFCRTVEADSRAVDVNGRRRTVLDLLDEELSGRDVARIHGIIGSIGVQETDWLTKAYGPGLVQRMTKAASDPQAYQDFKVHCLTKLTSPDYVQKLGLNVLEISASHLSFQALPILVSLLASVNVLNQFEEATSLLSHTGLFNEGWHFDLKTLFTSGAIFGNLPKLMELLHLRQDPHTERLTSAFQGFLHQLQKILGFILQGVDVARDQASSLANLNHQMAFFEREFQIFKQQEKGGLQEVETNFIAAEQGWYQLSGAAAVLATGGMLLPAMTAVTTSTVMVSVAAAGLGGAIGTLEETAIRVGTSLYKGEGIEGSLTHLHEASANAYGTSLALMTGGVLGKYGVSLGIRALRGAITGNVVGGGQAKLLRWDETYGWDDMLINGMTGAVTGLFGLNVLSQMGLEFEENIAQEHFGLEGGNVTAAVIIQSATGALTEVRGGESPEGTSPVGARGSYTTGEVVYFDLEVGGIIAALQRDHGIDLTGCETRNFIGGPVVIAVPTSAHQHIRTSAQEPTILQIKGRDVYLVTENSPVWHQLVREYAERNGHWIDPASIDHAMQHAVGTASNPDISLTDTIVYSATLQRVRKGYDGILEDTLRYLASLNDKPYDLNCLQATRAILHWQTMVFIRDHLMPRYGLQPDVLLIGPGYKSVPERVPPEVANPTAPQLVELVMTMPTDGRLFVWDLSERPLSVARTKPLQIVFHLGEVLATLATSDKGKYLSWLTERGSFIQDHRSSRTKDAWRVITYPRLLDHPIETRQMDMVTDSFGPEAVDLLVVTGVMGFLEVGRQVALWRNVSLIKMFHKVRVGGHLVVTLRDHGVGDDVLTAFGYKEVFREPLAMGHSVFVYEHVKETGFAEKLFDRVERVQERARNEVREARGVKLLEANPIPPVSSLPGDKAGDEPDGIGWYATVQDEWNEPYPWLPSEHVAIVAERDRRQAIGLRAEEGKAGDGVSAWDKAVPVSRAKELWLEGIPPRVGENYDYFYPREALARVTSMDFSRIAAKAGLRGPFTLSLSFTEDKEIKNPNIYAGRKEFSLPACLYLEADKGTPPRVRLTGYNEANGINSLLEIVAQNRSIDWVGSRRALSPEQKKKLLLRGISYRHFEHLETRRPSRGRLLLPYLELHKLGDGQEVEYLRTLPSFELLGEGEAFSWWFGGRHLIDGVHEPSVEEWSSPIGMWRVRIGFTAERINREISLWISGIGQGKHHLGRFSSLMPLVVQCKAYDWPKTIKSHPELIYGRPEGHTARSKELSDFNRGFCVVLLEEVLRKALMDGKTSTSLSAFESRLKGLDLAGLVKKDPFLIRVLADKPRCFIITFVATKNAVRSFVLSVAPTDATWLQRSREITQIGFEVKTDGGDFPITYIGGTGRRHEDFLQLVGRAIKTPRPSRRLPHLERPPPSIPVLSQSLRVDKIDPTSKLSQALQQGLAGHDEWAVVVARDGITKYEDEYLTERLDVVSLEDFITTNDTQPGIAQEIVKYDRLIEVFGLWARTRPSLPPYVVLQKKDGKWRVVRQAKVFDQKLAEGLIGAGVVGH